MSDMTNYAEYTVEKKCKGAFRFKRFLLKLALWVPAILICAVCIPLNFPAWVILIPVYPIVWLKMLKPYFYPFVYLEYEYQIAGGSIRFATIYGKCRRKENLEVTVSKMTAIAPYEGDYKKLADDPQIQKRYEFISEPGAPEIYFGIFENEDGEKCAVFFHPTNKALSLMRFLNRATVVKTVSV